jgi:2-polyprenyl-3-methyl-5-hydroxy-6-metoxy-1,4-benzoquinol methylase
MQRVGYNKGNSILFFFQKKIKYLLKYGYNKNISFVHRKKQGLCPGCLSNKVRKVDVIKYADVHLSKWGANVKDYLQIIDNYWRDLHFEIWACDSCQLLFVPKTVEGLIEKVETHPVFLEKVVKPYLDLFQMKFINKEYVDNLYYLHEISETEVHIKKILDLVGNYVAEGGIFLDLGSNIGAFTECVRIKYPQLTVCGCEINPYYYKIAKERYPFVDFSDKKLNESNSDMKFDFIFCSDVIEHIWDLDEFVGSIKNRLNKNGHLIFVTPDSDCPESKAQGTKWWAYIVPHHSQIFNISSLRSLLQRFGFKLIYFEKIGQEFCAVFTP